MWPRGRLQPPLPRLGNGCPVAMVDVTGEDARLPSDLLVGELGVLVVNMIMTPAMFARLAAVSSDVLCTARCIDAWEGLDIHLENRDVCLVGLARMMRTWRRATVLRLRYPTACMLEDHCRLLSILYPFAAHDRRCSIAATWGFTLVDVNPYQFLSSAAFEAGHELVFDLEVPRRCLPRFDVGWVCEVHDNTWEQLCFRVVPHGIVLEPWEDRARWYNGRAMDNDPAIRVPLNRRLRRGRPRARLTIGLTFTDVSMCLRINTVCLTHYIEPQFLGNWSQRKRDAYLVLSDEGDVLPEIVPRPIHL